MSDRPNPVDPSLEESAQDRELAGYKDALKRVARERDEALGAFGQSAACRTYLAAFIRESDEVVVAWTKAEAEVVQDELDAIEPLTGTCLESARSKLSTALEEA